MSDMFPSFFESRKLDLAPAKVANRAKVHDSAAKTLAPLAPLAAGDGRNGDAAPPTLAQLATLAGEECQIGCGARDREIHPAAIIVTPHQRAVSPDYETWRARAASLEQNAGLPREWAGPFARLLCGAPPRGFEPHRWGSVVEGASILADQWAAQARALGWSAEEIFGLDEIEPARRQDRKGVAWFLADGRRVVAIDVGGADIETARGVKQRFYRMNETISQPEKGDQP